VLHGVVSTGPPELIDIILRNGFRDLLRERYTDAASCQEDLLQLVNGSSRFPTLEDFLRELAFLTAIKEERHPEEIMEDGVVLSSIHQAKGLEWTAVFMVWCSEGMMPLALALKKLGGEEEERRLFYVTATHKKNRLYLCYPLTDYAWGIGNLTVSPSRFVTELSPYAARAKDCSYDQWLIDGK